MGNSLNKKCFLFIDTFPWIPLEQLLCVDGKIMINDFDDITVQGRLQPPPSYMAKMWEILTSCKIIANVRQQAAV